MVNLSDLASELLAAILDHLNHGDLSAVSHVSRRLRIVSEPFIYRSIKLLRRGDRIHLLLRTLLGRPELALYIWHFELSSWKLQGKVQLNLTDVEERLAKNLVTATNILPAKSGFRMIQHGKVDAGVALVLSMCANLKSLHLVFDCPKAIDTMQSYTDPPDEPVPKFARYTSIMLHRATLLDIRHGKVSNFPSLRKVEFGAEGTHVSYTLYAQLALNQSLPLFYLPNIQNLTLSQLETQTRSIPWPTARPCASSLTHLELTQTALAEDALGDLLEACPNLRYLKYGYVGDDERGESHFNCNKATQALSRVNKTLEHLILGITISSSSSSLAELWPSDCGIRGTMDFSHFRNLRSLRIPIAALLGMKADMTELPNIVELADVLPSSLRKLEITDELKGLRGYTWDSEAMPRYLGKYVMTKNVHSPDLEAIQIIRTGEEYKGTWWPRKTAEGLKDVCNIAGVAWETSDVGDY